MTSKQWTPQGHGWPWNSWRRDLEMWTAGSWRTQLETELDGEKWSVIFGLHHYVVLLVANSLPSGQFCFSPWRPVDRFLFTSSSRRDEVEVMFEWLDIFACKSGSMKQLSRRSPMYVSVEAETTPTFSRQSTDWHSLKAKVVQRLPTS